MICTFLQQPLQDTFPRRQWYQTMFIYASVPSLSMELATARASCLHLKWQQGLKSGLLASGTIRVNEITWHCQHPAGLPCTVNTWEDLLMQQDTVAQRSARISNVKNQCSHAPCTHKHLASRLVTVIVVHYGDMLIHRSTTINNALFWCEAMLYMEIQNTPVVVALDSKNSCWQKTVFQPWCS